ncbi:MAG: hypothetical protein M5U16_16535 [Hyphomicrobium sp.]|nr:hypothetical protein [Hyphomicrobium sp.]
MTEAADVPHAVELSGLFLEAADEKHAPIRVEPLLAREGESRRRLAVTGESALAAARAGGLPAG